MSLRYDSCWVTPADMSKYYVYGLYDDEGELFYIGKGKGYRVNNHFKPSLLKQQSHKNHKIKQLLEKQGYVRREILCYFDDEGSSYDFEEYLIGLYGIRNQGGILTNTLVSRNDFSEEALSKGRENSLKVNTRFTEDIAVNMVKEKEKNPSLSFKVIGEMFGISETRTNDFFCGNIDKLSHINTKHKPKTLNKFSEETKYQIYLMRVNGVPVFEIENIFNISKTHLYRVIREVKTKLGIKENHKKYIPSKRHMLDRANTNLDVFSRVYDIYSFYMKGSSVYKTAKSLEIDKNRVKYYFARFDEKGGEVCSDIRTQVFVYNYIKNFGKYVKGREVMFYNKDNKYPFFTLQTEGEGTSTDPFNIDNNDNNDDNVG